MNSSFLLALSPWLVFAFASRTGGLDFASSALLAAAWSVPVLVRSYMKLRRPRPFEIETTALFGLLATAGYALPAAAQVVSPYSRAIAVAGFVLLAFGSLFFRPFTDDYTREAVPTDRLSAKVVARTNLILSAAWGLTAMAMTVSFVVGAWVPGALWPTLLNWVVPMLLVLACLHFSMSRWYEDVEEPALIGASITAVFHDLGDEVVGKPPDRGASPKLRLFGETARRRR